MKPQSIEGDPSRKLAQHGLRATRQRIAVFRLLAEHREHPTALEVHRRLLRQQPSLSQKTVYEILDALVAAGIATRIAEGGGPARYEIPQRRHDHARCRVCGRLFDVPARPLRGRAGAPPGFRVEQVRVTIEGRCESCAG
jgi:Fur family peroxide stress response transcriptional regulator